VGIPVDLSGQIPFAHAVRDISTRGFSENRTCSGHSAYPRRCLQVPVPRAISSPPTSMQAELRSSKPTGRKSPIAACALTSPSGLLRFRDFSVSPPNTQASATEVSIGSEEVHPTRGMPMKIGSAILRTDSPVQHQSRSKRGVWFGSEADAISVWLLLLTDLNELAVVGPDHR
jgi:hypothetical protein